LAIGNNGVKKIGSFILQTNVVTSSFRRKIISSVTAIAGQSLRFGLISSLEPETEIWDLFGTCNLSFGIFSLELEIWDLEFPLWVL
jgi:hypothetical protein